MKFFEKYWKLEYLALASILLILVLKLLNLGQLEDEPHVYISWRTLPSTPRPRPDSRLEAATRAILEKTFSRPFPKVRPAFLQNAVTGGHHLELDCYNAELKLGVEVNGRQHYEYVPFFHRNKEAFYNQKYRDELKRRLCRDAGVRLVEIPYTVKEHDLAQYIAKYFNNINK
jgi:hypothetical protein